MFSSHHLKMQAVTTENPELDSRSTSMSVATESGDDTDC